MKFSLSRRQFLKMAATAAAAMGLNTTEVANLYKAVASYPASNVDVIWLQGQACSGDTVAFAQLIENVAGGEPTSGLWANNSLRFTPNSAQVEDVLLSIIDLQFHPTLMAPAGELAYQQLKDFYYGSRSTSREVIVVVEGSIPADGVEKVGENACVIANDSSGSDKITVVDALANIAKDALAVIAVGQCATFGGVPKAASYSQSEKYFRSGALSAQEVVSLITGTEQPPVVNLPGCPTNGWWVFDALVLALTYLPALRSYRTSASPADLQAIVDALDLDEFNRPGAIYGGTIHGGNCSRYQDYLSRIFQDSPGDYITPADTPDPRDITGATPPGAGESYNGGCLKKVGCKGMASHATCASVRWRSAPDQSSSSYYPMTGVGLWGDDPLASSYSETSNTHSACVNDNAPCQACTEKGFPDRFSPFVEYNN